MGTRERNSTNYNNPPQSNQDSSPRLSTAATLISSPTSNTRRHETQDHPHLHLHQGNHHHGFKLQKEQLEAQRSRRNPNPDPDPVRLVSQTPPPPQSTTARPVAAVVVRYRECLKNHGANMGTHVLDGCGEFMPGGEDDTPEALKCAACECHRSFHRREVEGESQSGYHTQQMATRIPLTHNPPPQAAPVPTPPAPLSQQQHHRYHHPMAPIMMAFGGANGAPAESSSEDLNIFRTYAGVQFMAQTSKKRFRTKFTEEQKEKMHDFAERIGWKMQKQDEQEVLQFCNEVGLKRKVFKVWMHNNKQATKKKQL
ncbi:zinc-finger homeodomain protein 6-like protein [Tanacetum coccineum]